MPTLLHPPSMLRTVTFVAAACWMGMCAGGRLEAEAPLIQPSRWTRATGEPVAYRATRRLEAWSADGRAGGWLEALTEFEPGHGLRVTVLRRGGNSDRIRDRVLPDILKGEQDAWKNGEMGRGALTTANYTFSEDRGDRSLLGIRLHPRRRERLLVDGVAWLQRQTGRLVRIEGRLAKSPSFWISRVDVVRSYQCVAGHVLPIAVESTAHVKLVGAYRFTMAYRYDRVDGRSVPAPRPSC